MHAEVLPVQEYAAEHGSRADAEENAPRNRGIRPEPPGEDHGAFIEQIPFRQGVPAGRELHGLPFVKGIIHGQRKALVVRVSFQEPFLAQAGIVLVDRIVPQPVQRSDVPAAGKDQIPGGGLRAFIFAGIVFQMDI